MIIKIKDPEKCFLKPSCLFLSVNLRLPNLSLGLNYLFLILAQFGLLLLKGGNHDFNR